MPSCIPRRLYYPFHSLSTSLPLSLHQGLCPLSSHCVCGSALALAPLYIYAHGDPLFVPSPRTIVASKKSSFFSSDLLASLCFHSTHPTIRALHMLFALDVRLLLLFIAAAPYFECFGLACIYGSNEIGYRLHSMSFRCL